MSSSLKLFSLFIFFIAALLFSPTLVYSGLEGPQGLVPPQQDCADSDQDGVCDQNDYCNTNLEENPQAELLVEIMATQCPHLLELTNEVQGLQHGILSAFPFCNQTDLDGDGWGNACDEDMDGDGISNLDELAQGTSMVHPDGPSHSHGDCTEELGGHDHSSHEHGSNAEDEDFNTDLSSASCMLSSRGAPVKLIGVSVMGFFVLSFLLSLRKLQKN